jgi:CDP-diglyceride synthetase
MIIELKNYNYGGFMNFKEGYMGVKMIKITKENIVHIIINLITYLSLLLIKDTGSGMMILIILIPLLISINSIIYGFKSENFDLLYIIISALLFIPFVYILMNESALVYVLIYLIIITIFYIIGYFIKKGIK